MKYMVIGLGIFGSSLAEKLTRMGGEVIGVDSRLDKVEAIKEKVTHAICLDSTDPQAVATLPLKDMDVVIVAIGQNEGANLLTTALMKQQQVKRLISRTVSPLHETILNAMGVEEIMRPEEETASRWAKKLNIPGILESYELAEENNIVEAVVPGRFAGRSLEELGFKSNYNVLVLTTIRQVEARSLFGIMKKVSRVQEVASAQTILKEGDILVLYGKIGDIQRLIREGGD